MLFRLKTNELLDVGERRFTSVSMLKPALSAVPEGVRGRRGFQGGRYGPVRGKNLKLMGGSMNRKTKQKTQVGGVSICVINPCTPSRADQDHLSPRPLLSGWIAAILSKLIAGRQDSAKGLESFLTLRVKVLCVLEEEEVEVRGQKEPRNVCEFEKTSGGVRKTQPMTIKSSYADVTCTWDIVRGF